MLMNELREIAEWVYVLNLSSHTLLLLRESFILNLDNIWNFASLLLFAPWAPNYLHLLAIVHSTKFHYQLSMARPTGLLYALRHAVPDFFIGVYPHDA